jgi:hypothetical protein
MAMETLLLIAIPLPLAGTFMALPNLCPAHTVTLAIAWKALSVKCIPNRVLQENYFQALNSLAFDDDGGG